MKKVSEFGLFVRQHRLKKGDTIQDLASYMGVSGSYLSMVELGKRAVPEGWLKHIIRYYHLDRAEARELFDAAVRSSLEVVLPMANYKEQDRALILKLAQQIKNLTREERDEIEEVLDASFERLSEEDIG